MIETNEYLIISDLIRLRIAHQILMETMPEFDDVDMNVRKAKILIRIRDWMELLENDIKIPDVREIYACRNPSISPEEKRDE